MKSFYVDKHGKPISRALWAELFEDDEYRVIAKTTVGLTEVSTVWIGAGYGGLIFETMTFPDQTVRERDVTLDEAKASHERVVAKLQLGLALA